MWTDRKNYARRTTLWNPYVTRDGWALQSVGVTLCKGVGSVTDAKHEEGCALQRQWWHVTCPTLLAASRGGGREHLATEYTHRISFSMMHKSQLTTPHTRTTQNHNKSFFSLLAEVRLLTWTLRSWCVFLVSLCRHHAVVNEWRIQCHVPVPWVQSTLVGIRNSSFGWGICKWKTKSFCGTGSTINTSSGHSFQQQVKCIRSWYILAYRASLLFLQRL
jgi:hypothetical protein